MKRLNGILIAVSLLLLAGCGNVDKMVETGNYDQALDKAVRKMAGKKKKTKYVEAAEHAFAKVTKRDMDRIKSLQRQGNLESWEKIYNTAHDIRDRQAALEPLLPLISEEGYQATFSFVQTDIILADATAQLSQGYFDLANQALLVARNNDKPAARDAYRYFEKVLRYDPDNQDAMSLKYEAEQLGITHILVSIKNQSQSVIPEVFERDLVDFNQVGRQSQWKQFHVEEDDAVIIDYMADLIIRNVIVQPEQVTESIHHFHREIKEIDYARDQNGDFVRDTSGNKIEIEVPREVYGKAIEVNQFKEVAVELDLKIHNSQQQLIRKEPMQAVGRFENQACRITGDRRAIQGRWLELGEPLPFPSTEALILTAMEELKIEVTNYLTGFQFERT